ncbi:MAG TPA: choice-of-anchor V domain-containing protein [Bryobacteraceae bacterium]|nr:choice-of-anchor V domain-containing protein [Bryobacteraceae bacterium]
MSRKNRIITGVAAVALLCAALLYAHAAGPDPWHTGAPGDDPAACTASGCHVGTPLNGGGGSVVVNFENGQTYTPGGPPQHFTIVITDSAAKKWGFQMTARLGSNLSGGQAGDFTAGTGQIVICSNHLDGTALFKGSKGCPGTSPVEFIEHYLQPFNTNTITVTWTPPATDVGDIHLYIAANAANGNTLETGDHIYTADYVLSVPAASCTNSTPTVSTVQSAGAFNPKAGLASGTWLEIYGDKLSCSTRGWAGGDFNGSNAPTSLDGIKVNINGVPAYIDYVSPTQVNVLAPDDPATGDGIQVVLTNSAGDSNAFAMQKNKIAPALLAPPSFVVNGKQWVVAQFPDLAFVGTPGLIDGVNFRPAKVGDTVVIYGIGFGAVNPATPAGTITPDANTLLTQPTFRFGQVPAKLVYAGLTPASVGLYQFNVVVPTVTPGDLPLNVDVGGVSLNQNLFITVSQ